MTDDIDYELTNLLTHRISLYVVATGAGAGIQRRIWKSQGVRPSSRVELPLRGR